ncbi:MAG TPA: hypothetical protein VF911_02470 [Thermoanaerobaculia bacterium]
MLAAVNASGTKNRTAGTEHELLVRRAPFHELDRVHVRRFVGVLRVAEHPDTRGVEEVAVERRERVDRRTIGFDRVLARLRGVDEGVVIELVVKRRKRIEIAADQHHAEVAQVTRVGIGTNERPHFMSCIAERSRERGADVAGGTGEEDSHGVRSLVDCAGVVGSQL